MPEGHTIHILATAHRKAFGGKRLDVSSPQGRFSAGAKSLSGHRLKDVLAYGKHLFYEFDNKKIVHIHLGLHGKFKLENLKKGQEAQEPRGAVRMRMLGPSAVLDLNGPIICDVIDRAEVDDIISKLGPEVLDPKADSKLVESAISKSGRSIAEMLMDQSVLCGIGNAYRCELLYRQRLHPLVPGKSLSKKQIAALWNDAVHLLKMGVRRGQAWAVDETDVKDPPTIDGEPDRYNVYRKSVCRGCGAKVKILALGRRKCHYCPKEQVQ